MYRPFSDELSSGSGLHSCSPSFRTLPRSGSAPYIGQSRGLQCLLGRSLRAAQGSTGRINLLDYVSTGPASAPVSPYSGLRPVELIGNALLSHSIPISQPFLPSRMAAAGALLRITARSNLDCAFPGASSLAQNGRASATCASPTISGPST